MVRALDKFRLRRARLTTSVSRLGMYRVEPCVGVARSIHSRQAEGRPDMLKRTVLHDEPHKNGDGLITSTIHPLGHDSTQSKEQRRT